MDKRGRGPASEAFRAQVGAQTAKTQRSSKPAGVPVTQTDPLIQDERSTECQIVLISIFCVCVTFSEAANTT